MARLLCSHDTCKPLNSERCRRDLCLSCWVKITPSGLSLSSLLNPCCAVRTPIEVTGGRLILQIGFKGVRQHAGLSVGISRRYRQGTSISGSALACITAAAMHWQLAIRNWLRLIGITDYGECRHTCQLGNCEDVPLLHFVLLHQLICCRTQVDLPRCQSIPLCCLLSSYIHHACSASAAGIPGHMNDIIANNEDWEYHLDRSWAMLQ